ncbi:MAG: hypothetical protein AAFO29_25675, partial [Actinomycetota bacterium]
MRPPALLAFCAVLIVAAGCGGAAGGPTAVQPSTDQSTETATSPTVRIDIEDGEPVAPPEEPPSTVTAMADDA